jgi:O-antigen/teichoic acid export membrane protein
MVIFYIGIANLFDIALGVSPHIIVNSKYYRYLSYFLLVFAVLIIVTNLILIPEFGIVGAAIAALVSKFIHNLIKYVFLLRKFGFQPFTIKYVYLLIIALAAYGISTLIPPFDNYIIDIIIRSAVIFLLFAIPVYFMKVSEDINERIDDILVKLKY